MNDNQDFTTGSIPKKMLHFMLPILGALVLQAMYSAVDLLIVGRFGTTEGISGVATGSNVMNLFTFFTCSLSVGVTVLMGQYIGEKNEHKLSELLGGATLFFILLSIVFSAIMLIFAENIAMIMQAPKEALDLTVQYIRICACGFVFVVLYNFISAVMRGIGNSKLPLIFVAIACVVNIIGDLVLVALFHMNVAGAALATILAQAISVILSVIIIRRGDMPFHITIKALRFNQQVKSFVMIGLPLGFQEILTNGTFLALCAFVNHMGLACSSGYGVAQKIQSFILLIPSAIMQSMASFVAQNVGAGKRKRGRMALFTGIKIGSLIGAVIAVFIFFEGDLLASIFTNDADVIARAFEFLRGFSPEAVVTCILFSYMGYFNAHSRSVFVMVQGLLQSLLVRLPVSYFMSVHTFYGLTGVGIAAPAATILGIVLCVSYDFYIINYEKKLQIDGLGVMKIEENDSDLTKK